MGPVVLTALLGALLFLCPCAHAAVGLASVRKAGLVRCGIDRSEAEFSLTDEHGARIAFDEAFCKAFAVAVLGREARIVVKTYPDDLTSISALKSGAIDVIASVSLDLTHRKDLGLSFSRPSFYDGQGLMVLRKAGLAKPADLTGKLVCFLDETEGAESIRSWFRQRALKILPFPFQEQGEMEAAFVAGNCAALAGDITRLANFRASLGRNAGEYVILPALFSTDPIAAAYLSTDREWGLVVEWTLEVLLGAEERGITSANEDSMGKLDDLSVQRLLGSTHELGTSLGLNPMWAADVVRSVGNYAELYDRTFGQQSDLKLPRGRNALWKDGGLMEALPIK